MQGMHNNVLDSKNAQKFSFGFAIASPACGIKYFPKHIRVRDIISIFKLLYENVDRYAKGKV